MPIAKLRCKQCKDYELRDKIVKTPFGKFCSREHAMLWANDKLNMDNKKKLAKVKTDKNKIEKQTKLKYKLRKDEFNLNDVPKQHKLTQTAFNRLRVLQEIEWFKNEGLDPYCISCGKKNMDWCCGHLKTRGSQSNLRYDVNNTFLQCNRYCNMALSGNIEGNKNTHGYKKGLALRFGELEASRILNYCEKNTQVKKWTGSELKDLRTEFNKQIKELTPID